MNERIKEFACMSGLNVDGEESFSEFAEKTRLSCFAELIVRECSHIAAKNQAEDMGWDISEIIKEHFGVEE